MSIFSAIKDAIFGKKDSVPAPAPAAAAPAAAPDTPDAPPAAAPAAMDAVDVEAILSNLSDQAGGKFNWRTSIVDLMKLLGMESSLAERRELAGELGYTGDTDDTATMNIWLHGQVMQKLAENGGKVPDSLLPH